MQPEQISTSKEILVFKSKKTHTGIAYERFKDVHLCKNTSEYGKGW